VCRKARTAHGVCLPPSVKLISSPCLHLVQEKGRVEKICRYDTYSGRTWLCSPDHEFEWWYEVPENGTEALARLEAQAAELRRLKARVNGWDGETKKAIEEITKERRQ
jgi:hypothetical protein